jgi:hypothetical protein
MSRLGSSLFKIIWAQQHLDQLRDEARKYVDSHPYHFPTEVEGDQVLVYPPEIVNSPEFSIAGLIGDCMNNLMAALDYIVWELAVAHAGRPVIPPPVGVDKPSFPLFADPAVFAKNPNRFKGYNFPASALAEIERVQPYHAGYEPLAQLFVLVNQDKHRLPLLLMGQVQSGDIGLLYRETEFKPVSSATTVTFNTGDPRLAPYDPREMKVNTQVTPFIAFQDASMPREPIEVTVERIAKCVGTVVSAFIDKKII